MLKSALGRFRIVALAEGASYVLLLGVAMPLKYMMDMPIAVRIVGSLHGFLFVVYLFALLSAALTQRWSIIKTIVAFIASVIPLGAFFFDVKIKDEVPAEEQDKQEKPENWQQ
jgi:integral membrane protein